jgi:hypothetical protein
MARRARGGLVDGNILGYGCPWGSVGVSKFCPPAARGRRVPPQSRGDRRRGLCCRRYRGLRRQVGEMVVRRGAGASSSPLRVLGLRLVRVSPSTWGRRRSVYRFPSFVNGLIA